jgi:2-hydroxychromene-2-carboxylate isomerase
MKMAEVIQLTPRRLREPVDEPPPTAPATFYFDLAGPGAYLVAERVERHFDDVHWQAAVPWRAAPLVGEALAHRIATAERQAAELRMPLVWPERFPAPVPAAMRVATYAAAEGRGGAFAIAAGRLAFCGGFDVEDPDIIAEAAAAAGLDIDEAARAAREARRDDLVAAAGRALWAEGCRMLPALRTEGRLYGGEERIVAALIGGPRAVASRPLIS